MRQIINANQNEGEQKQNVLAKKWDTLVVGDYNGSCYTLCSVIKWINIDQSKHGNWINFTLWWG